MLGAAHPARGPGRGETDPLRGGDQVRCQDGLASLSPRAGVASRPLSSLPLCLRGAAQPGSKGEGVSLRTGAQGWAERNEEG